MLYGYADSVDLDHIRTAANTSTKSDVLLYIGLALLLVDAVNCTPWSVLNTSGRPPLNASSSISRQNEPSNVLDNRQAIT